MARLYPLAKFGYNRDKKKGKLQIVFGLLCNAQGFKEDCYAKPTPQILCSSPSVRSIPL